MVWHLPARATEQNISLLEGLKEGVVLQSRWLNGDGLEPKLFVQYFEVQELFTTKFLIF